MQIRAYFSTPPSAGSVLRNSAPLQMAARTARRREAGITLVETMISLMVVLIGTAGLFATGAQSFRLLRRSKETVTVRECILTRLDSIRALSYTEVARPIPPSTSTGSDTGPMSTKLIAVGAAFDPNPYGGATSAMKNFKETVSVYALGPQIFSSDAQRLSTTPDYPNEYASQLDTPAPSAPKTYISNTSGQWVPAVTNPPPLPYYQISRVGSGASAQITVDTTGCATYSNDLSSFPALRVDVLYTWTDSSNNPRTLVGTTILARNGSFK